MKVLKLVALIAIIAAVVVVGLRDDPPKEQALENQLHTVAVDDDEGSLTTLRGSEFELRYGTSSSTPLEDMELLAGLLQDAWLLVKDADRIPLADNHDFARFLCGENQHRVAWIPPGHRSLSRSGEVIDRWGTPLFFHRESSRQTELRSAGPDRKMWSEDDLAYRPWDQEISE